MKKNILKNIQIDHGEKVFKDFRQMSAKGYTCQIILTTRRLIIYSYGLFMSRGRRAKQKRMNEISLKTIHRIEYYIEYLKNNIWIRLTGFVLFLAALYSGYLLYMGRITIPESILPYQPYTKYIAVGIVVFITFIMMFKIHKTLYFNINSGSNERTTLKLNANKYNETAIKYISSKVQTS